MSSATPATPCIYLAGPEVFLPNAPAMGAAKKRLCRQYGFTGLYPLDHAIAAPPAGERKSRLIFEGNVRLLESADLVIANLTPFRGPSADAGTVYEIGFMAGRGKLVLGYSNVAGTYLEKTRQLGGIQFQALRQAWVDRDEMAVEDFANEDNLMLTESLWANGHPLVVRDIPPAERYRNLEAFEECLRLARRKMGLGG